MSKNFFCLYKRDALKKMDISTCTVLAVAVIKNILHLEMCLQKHQKGISNHMQKFSKRDFYRYGLFKKFAIYLLV